MLLLLGSFLALMLIGLPVALAMAVSSLLYILWSGMVPDVIVAQRMIAGVESFPLLAVPFFILAGNLMNIAGVTGRIYAFAVALVGWMKGGLGQVNVIGSVTLPGCRAPRSPTPRASGRSSPRAGRGSKLAHIAQPVARHMASLPRGARIETSR